MLSGNKTQEVRILKEEQYSGNHVSEECSMWEKKNLTPMLESCMDSIYIVFPNYIEVFCAFKNDSRN